MRHAAEGDGAGLPDGLIADRMEVEAEPAWDAILDAVRGIVERAESLEALRDALLGAFADLPTAQLTEVMAMGFAATDLAGRFDAGGDSEGGPDAA